MAIRSLSAKPAPNQNNTDSTAVVGLKAAATTQKSRIAKQLLAIGCLGFVVVGSTGCTMTSGVCRAINRSECIDNFMIDYRNRALAEKAWHCEKHRFCDQRAEFKAGFIAGYIEVASGGPGCCPSVAPSQYWGWRYQSAGGQQAVNAWFAGYPMGVQSAETAGLGHYQQIHTTGLLQAPAALAPAIPAMDAEVTNPFYSQPEEEFIPAPQVLELEPGAAEPDVQPEAAGGDALKQPEEVLNQAFDPVPVAEATVTDDPELVFKSDVAESHEAAVSAKFGDQTEEFPIAPEVVVDDIFGTPTTPVHTNDSSDELPFSFE